MPPAIQLGPANGDLEHLRDLFRVDATTDHASAELALVQFPAPHGPHLIQHLILSAGKMLTQPLSEHWRDCVWQAQDHVPGTGRPCLGGGGDDRRDLVIGATSTPVGMPTPDNSRIARNRAAGEKFVANEYGAIPSR